MPVPRAPEGGGDLAGDVQGAPLVQLPLALQPRPILEAPGRVAGRVFALSTAGSLIGTFVPALITIPLIGTQRTLIGAAMIIAAAEAVRDGLDATITVAAVVDEEGASAGARHLAGNGRQAGFTNGRD